jgi:hypothetical protein
MYAIAIHIYKYLLERNWRQSSEDLFLVVCVILAAGYQMLRCEDMSARMPADISAPYGSSGGSGYLRSYYVAKVSGWLETNA